VPVPEQLHGPRARRDIDLLVLEELEVRLVRRAEVVAVEAVLDEQLPVRLDAVLMRAAQDLEGPRPAVFRGAASVAVRRERGRDLGRVHHGVDVRACAGKVVDEIFYVGVVAREDQASVRLHPRHLDEPILGLVERRTVGLLVGHADERAVGVVRPCVIEALERLGVAAIASTDGGAAMPAAIREHAHLSRRPAASEEQLPLPNRPANEVAAHGHLGLVTDIEPAAVEDPLDLGPVNRLRRQS